MRVIVSGSRDYGFRASDTYVAQAIKESGFEITELVSGGATGIDQGGERWARYRSISIKRFLPNWDKFKKAAGHRRNLDMANYADALIAIHHTNVSNGTKSMIRMAELKGLKIYVLVTK